MPEPDGEGRDVLDCEELEELAGALALGAALPHEVEAAQSHLAGCPRSHTDVYELAAVARLLAEAPEPVEPPARLRARILATAREDTAPRAAAPASPPPPVTTSRPPAPVTPLPLRRWPGWVAAAAAVVAALALGLWNVQLRDDLSARDARVAEQQRLIDAVAGGRTVAFAPAAGQEGLHGTVLRPSQGTALAVFAALPRPAGGRVYQLWAIRGGAPQDLGIFLPDARGRSTVALPDLTGVDALAVTVERERVPAPTGAPILTAPL